MIGSARGRTAPANGSKCHGVARSGRSVRSTGQTSPTTAMRALLALVLLLALAAPAAHGQSASFQGLGFLGTGSSSVATGVSADGAIVVGSGSTAIGGRAFRWTAAGGMVDLGIPTGGGSSNGTAISADGSAIAGTANFQQGLEAFRWTAASGIVLIGNPPPGESSHTDAFGISADGLVVVGRGFFLPNETAAFRWTAAGGMVNLGRLPGAQFGSSAQGASADGAVVVGSSSSASNDQAFRWTAAGGMVGLGVLPGRQFSSAAAVSPDGAVVVGSSQINGASEAFRWTATGGMVGLGDLPGGTPGTTGATAVSADGSVVVGFGSDSNGRQGFIWTGAEGLRSLRGSLVAALGPDSVAIAGWTQLVPAGLSADGRSIVGSGTNPQGQTEAWRATLGPAARTFTVTDAGDAGDADPGDGRCDVDASTPGDQCTLRAALREANLVGTAQAPPRIVFAITGGATLIQPTSTLPVITRTLTLDASGQPGVRLDGSLLSGGADGLTITADSVVVRGLAVTGFPDVGIVVSGSAVQIVGNDVGFVGTTPAPNDGGGILVTGGATDVTIGSASAAQDAADRNDVYGGVAVTGATTRRVRVLRNVLEVSEAASRTDLRAPLDLGADGPTCTAWVGTGAAAPNDHLAPPRLLTLAAGGASGVTRPGATVVLYRVEAGSGYGRYWARRAEPVGTATADAAGRFDLVFDAPLAAGARVAATATDAEGNTSELSQLRRPVIFSPGIGGSWLEDAGGTPLWVPISALTDAAKNDRLARLALHPNGTSVEPITVNGVIENALGLVDIAYGPGLAELETSGFLGHPFNEGPALLDLWRLANDWRLSPTVLADEMRAMVDALTVSTAATEDGPARSCEVDLLGHSNGGMIAALYVRRDAAHARDRVHRLLTSATPYLGAVQAMAGHEGGYVFGLDEELHFDAEWGRMLQMTRNVPGAYDLLPSRAFWDAADPASPSHSHGYATVDLYNTPLVGYDATFDFYTDDKVTVDGVARGLARNGPMWVGQQEGVHALIDDWRTYDGPPQVFRQAGSMPLSTAMGWFMGRGPELLAPGQTDRDEPGDTDRHRAWRERLLPIPGRGDATVPLLSSTLGRNAGVGRLDLSGVDESEWIEEFEYYACGHVPMFAPDCHPIAGGPDAIPRIVEILDAGHTVPSAARANRPAGGTDDAREILYVSAGGAVSVVVEDALGNRTGPASPDSLGTIVYDVPGIRYYASLRGVALVLLPDQPYTVTVSAPAGPATVHVTRLTGAEGATTAALLPDQALAGGGALRLAYEAPTAPAAAWALDADGDGTFEGTLAPSAVLAGTGAVPPLPLPRPTAVEAEAVAGTSTPVAVDIALPDLGGPAWTWTLAEDVPWLTASASAGQTPATLGLALSAAALAPGTYTDTLAVTLGQGGYTTVVAVPVTLTVAMTTAGEPEAAPAETALLGLVPNPLGGRGAVRYNLATPGPVRLAVYDVLGREVAVLADGERAAGTYEARLDAGHLAPGVYVVRLATPGQTLVQRLTVAR